MSIRIRRGTNTDRLTVILEQGEVAYTTDTKKFYIGDGVTIGGTEIGSGTLTSVTASTPLSSSGGNTPNISIQDAVADGTTKGAATFNASDFNSSSGVVSIDYTNGQSASASTKGFLTSTDWTTFNNKGNGTVTSVTGTSPIASSGGVTPAISIQDAVADGTTKGAATFTASDFNSLSGVISIDYGNGQSASATSKGFLTSADWVSFNSKGNIISVSGSTPIQSSGGTTPTISIQNAAADGTTKGAATFTASDFNSTSGVISIDYANGQTASASNNGFLSSTDWTTFNNKGNGTVTSVSALTIGTTGIDLSSSVSTGTTTPVITLNVPTASATNRGALSAADWTTFNSKQGALTLTTTGSSGAATLVGNTLNVPQYSGGGSSTAVDIQAGWNALGSGIKGTHIVAPDLIPRTSNSLGSGTLSFNAYYLPVATTITGVKWYQVTKGNYTANNYNGVALYSYSAGTLTLVASSTNDGTIWSTPSTQTWGSKAFSSTYSASAGIYFIGILYSSSAQTTAPALGQPASAWTSNLFNIDYTNSARSVTQITGQTSLASSYSTTALATTGNPWIAFLY